MKRFVAASAVSMMIMSPAFADENIDALHQWGEAAAIAKKCYGSDTITNLLEAIGRKKLADKSSLYVAINGEIRDAMKNFEENNLVWDGANQKYIKFGPVNCSKLSDTIKTLENDAVQKLSRTFP